MPAVVEKCVIVWVWVPRNANADDDDDQSNGQTMMVLGNMVDFFGIDSHQSRRKLLEQTRNYHGSNAPSNDVVHNFIGGNVKNDGLHPHRVATKNHGDRDEVGFNDF